MQRKTISILLGVVTSLLFPLATPLHALQEASFSWSPNTETNLAGYKIHYGTTSAQYDHAVDMGNPTPTNGVVAGNVNGLIDGTTYYFTATAYDTDGFESDFSQEVVWTAPSEPPVVPPSLPVAQDMTLSVDEDTTVLNQLEGHSPDDLPLTYQIVTNGIKGTATISNAETGNFSYQPNAEINGIDTFTYRVNDANGASEIATVTMAINSVNDLPVADSAILVIQEDNAVSGILAGSDIDSQNLTRRIVTNGLLGTAVITDPASGVYTYTPNQGVFGNDVFQFVINDGYGDSNVATVSVTIEQTPPEFTMETGEVTASGNWMPVVFSETFRDPVVVAMPASFADPAPCTIRIRNVTATSFEMRLQQYDYLDQEHGQEKVGYIAMERGSFTLDNGSQVEAGTFDHQSGGYPMTVSFAGEFPIPPVVATAVVTNQEIDAVVGRVSNVTAFGFDYEMQEQEANLPEHGVEKIAYIAWEPSSGMVGEYAYEVAENTDEIDSGWRKISFQEGFTDPPVFIADIQSINDGDTANLRLTELSATGVLVKVAEEQSYDTETDHDPESIGFMAISWINLDGDADDDTLLTRDERELYDTSPALPDTDADGLDDGAEVSYWGSEWHTDIDGDGIINLLDADSDNDGFLDGEEITQGSDPGDSNSTPGSNEEIAGPVMEYGTASVSTPWQRISFNKSFVNPVVIAKIVSLVDKSPCFARITNVDTTGFDLRLQEWDYLNDKHSVESVSYLVMEQGSYVLADGTKIEAGMFSTNMTTYAPIQFAQQFTVVPVVTASVTSINETDGVIGRANNISTSSMDFKLQEQEGNPQIHATETVSYIAWEPSTGILNGMVYNIANAPNAVTDKLATVNFNTLLSNVPTIVTDMQSAQENDTATVRCKTVSAGSVELWLEEEKSKDKEISHSPEQVSYMAFGL
ncbi:MAG: cadherin-like domain-containing protein [Proteobacteria bacterium]|nr:cadherin-like domain-containing protein [Pseudomonadota bacterium]MBU4294790.1 cadherin-like domain-containing protein [Pseudomonadota bacterium]MCG2748068.1 Ig-like domain-containing protein [Desulfobulbaceae bacterium]